MTERPQREAAAKHTVMMGERAPAPYDTIDSRHAVAADLRTAEPSS
jgi:hypothetical protein